MHAPQRPLVDQRRRHRAAVGDPAATVASTRLAAAAASAPGVSGIARPPRTLGGVRRAAARPELGGDRFGGRLGPWATKSAGRVSRPRASRRRRRRSRRRGGCRGARATNDCSASRVSAASPDRAEAAEETKSETPAVPLTPRGRRPRGAPAISVLPLTTCGKIAPSAAMPVAMPTCRNVELMPDAMPARRGSTTPTAAVASAGLTRPMPAPQIRKPASSAVQSSPGWSAAHEQQPEADGREPAADEPAHAEALGELAGDRRHDEREQRDRQEAQAGLERRVAERRSGCRASGRGTSRTSTPTARTRRSTRRRTSACGTATGRASGARPRSSIDHEGDQQHDARRRSSARITSSSSPRRCRG